jgi:DnaJ domain
MACLMGSSSMARSSVSFPAIAGRRGVRCSATVSGENYYKTLSLRPGATEKEVKKAFRKLALKVCILPSSNWRFSLLNFNPSL